jgi:hypothetical protein
VRRSPLLILLYRGYDEEHDDKEVSILLVECRLSLASLRVSCSAAGKAMWFLPHTVAGSAVLLLMSLWIVPTQAHSEGNLP